jgi:hypothetical protein
MTNKFLMFFLLFSCATLAYGEIFKWVDEQGNTQYGDKPNDEQSATRLNIVEPESKKVLPEEEDRDERRRRLADVMQEDRLKKKEEKKKALEQKNELDKKCVYAKDQLRQYEDSGYLYTLDKDGNRIPMPDEHRTAAINDLRAKIKTHCGN